jgi:hypothetical protein
MLSARKIVSVLVGLLLAQACSAADWHLVSWVGNSKEWNRQLGISEYRLACSSAPAPCMESLRYHATKDGIDSVVMAMVASPEQIADYAAQYAAASLKEKKLRGVGIDDFVKTLLEWQQAAPATPDAPHLLEQVIANVRRANPTMLFGVTVYEDELSSPALRDLPAALRAKIDRVSLYLHYRANGKDYPEYARRVRQLFPNARLFGGVYAYDRIDYVPCAGKRGSKCSVAQEKELFRQTFATQVAMLKNGQLDGLEFYPGYFGAEQDWRGWSKPRNCSEARRQECIDVTKSMRAGIVQALEQAR